MRTRTKVILILIGLLLIGYVYGQTSDSVIKECQARGYSYDYCVIATG